VICNYGLTARALRALATSVRTFGLTCVRARGTPRFRCGRALRHFDYSFVNQNDLDHYFDYRAVDQNKFSLITKYFD
jgi:hypothetical protein